jgi:hypothetical protein
VLTIDEYLVLNEKQHSMTFLSVGDTRHLIPGGSSLASLDPYPKDVNVFS